MILLSRFLDTFWIEPNAENFFAKHVPEEPLGYSHLHGTIDFLLQFREAAHMPNAVWASPSLIAEAGR